MAETVAVAILRVVHRAEVRQEAATVQQERAPFVEVLVNVCPPVTTVSIVMGLVHVRHALEEAIIGL